MRRNTGFACLLAFFPAIALAGAPLEFRVTFTPEISSQPFTGRVYVLLGNPGQGEPRFGPNWFNPAPMLAVDVKDVKPGTQIVVGDGAVSLPADFKTLKAGKYRVQAVLDRDQGARDALGASSNAFSVAKDIEIDVSSSGPVDLKIDQLGDTVGNGGGNGKGRRSRRRGGDNLVESERVKLAEMDSKLLSAFHGKPIKMQAGVVLPKSFATSGAQKYPIIFDIPGFTGTHTGAAFMQGMTDVAGTEMIYVVLNPDCRLGHHVFADSANNGPVGKALIEEFIPYIEAKFRGIGKPYARLLTGHSSGGWSSLWLQVTYPDFFGGTWSTSPDPVDFRDFQRINIYRPGENMFRDAQNELRPLARMNGRVMVTYKQFSDMENVVNRGGQLTSFEAVFSSKGADGKPRKLWDRSTGAIDLEVAKEWERYDIRKILEENWPTLGPKLSKKIHVYMGEEDTFYLEGATKLLKESLAKLQSDAKVELFPGKDHGTLRDYAMSKRIAEEMAAAVAAGKESK